MTDRPILFSAPMVRAILAGAKTQTRRELRVQPFSTNDPQHAEPRARGNWVWMAFDDRPRYSFATGDFRCPYGVPGDRLWVREAFRLCAEADATPPRDTDAAYRVWYEADAPHQPGAGKLRPGMFMPRWASRITLEVVGVRVERLQAISEADALAEGVQMDCTDVERFCARAAYRTLWNEINGPGSWAANPWAWAVEFKQVTP